jgi:hypothetical protein
MWELTHAEEGRAKETKKNQTKNGDVGFQYGPFTLLATAFDFKSLLHSILGQLNVASDVG